MADHSIELREQATMKDLEQPEQFKFEKEMNSLLLTVISLPTTMEKLVEMHDESPSKMMASMGELASGYNMIIKDVLQNYELKSHLKNLVEKIDASKEKDK